MSFTFLPLGSVCTYSYKVRNIFISKCISILESARKNTYLGGSSHGTVQQKLLPITKKQCFPNELESNGFHSQEIPSLGGLQGLSGWGQGGDRPPWHKFCRKNLQNKLVCQKIRRSLMLASYNRLIKKQCRETYRA